MSIWEALFLSTGHGTTVLKTSIDQKENLFPHSAQVFFSMVGISPQATKGLKVSR